MEMRVRDLQALQGYVRLLGTSQRGLARGAGVGHATLNHLLSGRRGRCSDVTAVAIERALGCPVGVFFEPVRRGPSPWPGRFGDSGPE